MPVVSARSGRAAPLPPDERRLAILKAVLPVVRARGADVTTRELAEAAGVAEGTLFRVFDDKDSLLREALTAALDPTDLVAQLGEIDLALPLEARVAAAFRLGVARIEDLTLWVSLLHRFGRGPEAWKGRHGAGPHTEWAKRQASARLLVRAQLHRLLEPDEHRFRHPLDTVIGLLELILAGAIAQGADRFRAGTGAGVPEPGLLVDFFLRGVVGPATASDTRP